MKKKIVKLIWFVCIATAIGGRPFFEAIFSTWWQLIKISFPTIFPYLIESFFTSPSFIVGFISILCFFVGVILTLKTKKKLYKIISLVTGIIGLISTLSGFLQ